MEIAQVTALMEQKKKALREFQAVTQKMLECSRDDLKKLVEKRDHLIREMDRAEAEIQAQLTDLEEADPVRQAVAGTLGRHRTRGGDRGAAGCPGRSVPCSDRSGRTISRLPCGCGWSRNRSSIRSALPIRAARPREPGSIRRQQPGAGEVPVWEMREILWFLKKRPIILNERTKRNHNLL